MFSGLDDFLDGNIVDKARDDEINDLSASNVNDSFDLEFELTIPKARDIKKFDGQSSKNKNKDAVFVPGKGQKTVAKRLQKIEGTLNKDLKEQEFLQTLQNKRTNSKPAKASNGRRVRSPQKTVPQRQTTHRTINDPNVIVLDADDVFAVSINRNLKTASAVTDEDDSVITVSIRINGKTEEHKLNAFSKLAILVTKIAEQKSVQAEQITLMFKNKQLSTYETFKSIGYLQGLIIYAHISDEVSSKLGTALLEKAKSNQLEIKIRAEGRKKPFITYISPDEPFVTLAYACAEEFKCEVSKVALEFDGEFLDFKDTPENLGLDGGEQFDFFQK